MIYVPRSPNESMIRGAPRPITESPIDSIDAALRERCDEVRREIARLQRVLFRRYSHD